MRVIYVSVLVLVLALGAALSPVSAAAHVYYTVQNGDTLYDISRQYGVSVGVLSAANRLRGDLIVPNQVLVIPEHVLRYSRGDICQEELALLARIIHAEARGESFAGQVAVGAVIMNRLASPDFPSDLRSVIFQRSASVFQFSPVGDGSIVLSPDERAFQAAKQALRGMDPTHGALFFYNPKLASDTWIRTLPVITTIGNHVFATKI
ncbi:cell wall hydrolase [Candidatus Desulforudis audaxviator]|nr:cell wall hydrolase [Candidatus Desulforudis audaxviator]AZK59389.1 Spore cortex-lytic enzyme, lytic transglycosylase SleB [Candidatus Desulforudis audaxviator]